MVAVDGVFEAFEPLLDDFDDDLDNGFIRLPFEGWHRTAFVNKGALDYVVLPTHRIEQGRIDMEAKLLDESA